jgi:hypothetical protein
MELTMLPVTPAEYQHFFEFETGQTVGNTVVNCTSGGGTNGCEYDAYLDGT